ncbi:sialidase family protein [Paenibacillus cymbidii]|uniref:sialidase family protein n=1 Tax=Paenibacillus cymbidii TaxID=1639034 RepID=UPI001080FE18|nr:sialidase family protein [Paenibacillus cymbidii]
MHKLGQRIMDLPPAEGNPRNSEGAFLDLSGGRLLFVYSKFTGTSWDDAADSVIVKRVSEDGGATWSDDEVVVGRDEHSGAPNKMSASLLRMNDGGIGLIYLVRESVFMHAYLRRSADEGRTWSAPVRCMPSQGHYCVNNDRVVRLSSGRLIMPCEYSLMPFVEFGEVRPVNLRSILLFYLSDDDGATWRESKTFYTLHIPRIHWGLEEPGVVELKDGTLWAWARTHAGYQYETFSTDGGDNWSMPVPSAFTSPNSPLSMKRIPGRDCLLAVWNPIPNYQTRRVSWHNAGRTPLVGAVSRDEGKTWERFFTIEDDEDAGYCYTAIHPAGDAVLLAYCAGNADDGVCHARLRLKRIEMADVFADN